MTAALVVLASVAGGIVVFYLYRAVANAVALRQRDAALRVEVERAEQLESAREAERQQRAKDFDAKAAAVRTASDAADLLRGELGGNPRPHPKVPSAVPAPDAGR